MHILTEKEAKDLLENLKHSFGLVISEQQEKDMIEKMKGSDIDTVIDGQFKHPRNSNK